jgi:hypothetical protein
MAQIYYPKKTSTKLAEGAIAGLIGGAATLTVLALFDVFTPERSWWTTISLFGSTFTGVRNFNTASPDLASLVLGVLLVLAVLTLAGVGFINYLVLFRRFKIPAWLGGATYGVLIGGSFMILLNAWWPDIVRQQNVLAVLIASAIGGAVVALWLSTRPTSERPA